MPQPPWVSGPSEILQHGLSLLKNDNDSNRRLAMLSIDNSVELMLKTYLGLPKRVTGIELSRKQFQEISESFPDLLDAIEKHAAEKLEGINLAEIEFFHRLRNQLYHQGNGLTVAKNQIEPYAELAKILFRNLFGFDATTTTSENKSVDLLGDFLTAWVEIERSLSEIVEKNPFRFKKSRGPLGGLFIVGELADNRLIKAFTADRINELRDIRNRAVHGVGNFREKITLELINETKSIAEQLKNLEIPELRKESNEGKDSDDETSF